MVAEEAQKNEERRKRIEKSPDLRITGIKSDIKRIDNEIVRQQKWLDESGGQIATLLERINSVPGAEVAIGALDREYQTKKGNYDSLLAQQQRIALGYDAASQQQGESIQVVDPANLPSQPVAPKRFMLFAMGLGLGLGVGLLLAGVFEVPKLLTIQNSEDVAHYTGLPVLVSVLSC